jgi:hypothetical protein
MTVLKHIAGSTFGLTASAEDCPIVDPTGDPTDTTGWGVHLHLVSEQLRINLQGQWLSALSPWTMAFSSVDTLAWPEGIYECRLVYIEPAPVGRRFEIPTDLQLEVIR